MKASTSFPERTTFYATTYVARDPHSAYSVWKQCERKTAYSTEEFANSIVAKRTAAGVRALKSYLCGHCTKWHIGHRK